MSFSPSPFQRVATAFTPGLTTSPTTTAAISLFVSSSGSDSNDGLTVGTPLLTLQAALAKVPKLIFHNVTITLAAGTYTGTYDMTGYTISPNVLFTVTGAMAAAILATGTSTGTVGTVTALSGATVPQSFVDLTQTWTVNDLRGKWVSFNGSTTYRMICANTATSITLVGNSTVTTGQSYAILSPTATLLNSASTTPTVLVSNNAAGVATILFTALNITNSVSNGTAFAARGGFSICRYCAITGSGASFTQGASCFQGSLSLGTCFVSASGSCVNTQASGTSGGLIDILNIGGSYLLQPSGNTSQALIVGAQQFIAVGLWVERVAVGSTVELVSIVGLQGGSVSGPTVLAMAAGSTNPGIRLNATTSTGLSRATAAIFSTLSISNCAIGVLCLSNTYFCTITALALTNCTTGIAVLDGGEARMNSVCTTAFSGLTNELQIDNAYTTWSALPYITNGSFAFRIATSTNVPSITQGPITLYVNAATGLYTNDGLSATTPLLTIQAAINKIPKAVQHNVVVNIAAGTSFAGATVAGFSGGSPLAVHGTLSAFTPATGVQTGTADTGTNSTTLVKPAAAANWTASNLVGAFLRVISGGGAGTTFAPTIRPIKANTTTTLTVDAVSGMDNTTVFDIVAPGTTLTANPDGVNDNALSVSFNLASVAFRFLKFSGSLNYLAKALDSPGSVTFEGCQFDLTATTIELLAQRCGSIYLKNCVFKAGAGASLSSSYVTVTNVWMSAAGTITISDAQIVTVRGLDSASAVGRVLGAFRTISMSAEVKANNGGATPVYLEDVTNFSVAGANLLVGSDNTGYGLEMAKTGRYTLTGSSITGSLGDILFFGSVNTWSQVSSPSFGIISEHAGSAVANASYTKALVYGNRTFVGNVDVSGRLLNYGYFNTAGNLSVPTLTGTQALDMETGQINGVDGGLNGSPRGQLEVICSSVNATVTLPSNFTINGGWCVIMNRGASALKVLPPSPGTVNGTTFVTVPANTAKMFVSLNGNGGKDFWMI